jgi:hypothetical protein
MVPSEALAEEGRSRQQRSELGMGEGAIQFMPLSRHAFHPARLPPP